MCSSDNHAWHNTYFKSKLTSKDIMFPSQSILYRPCKSKRAVTPYFPMSSRSYADTGNTTFFIICFKSSKEPDKTNCRQKKEQSVLLFPAALKRHSSLQPAFRASLKP